jgi:hypothetical protein
MGNLHRIGPANGELVGNRALGGRKNGNGRSLEIEVDSILKDLLFQDGATRAAQGEPQIQQGSCVNRRRFVESARLSLRGNPGHATKRNGLPST